MAQSTEKAPADRRFDELIAAAHVDLDVIGRFWPEVRKHRLRRPAIVGDGVVEDDDRRAMLEQFALLAEINRLARQVEQLHRRTASSSARLRSRLPALPLNLDGCCAFCGLASPRLKRGLCPSHYESFRAWSARRDGADVSAWATWRRDREEANRAAG